MIIIALLLLVAAAALIVLMLVAGHGAGVLMEVSQIGLSWTPTPLMIYIMGAATVLMIGAGLGLIRTGTRRRMGRRREMKRLRKEAATTPPATSSPTDSTTGRSPY